MSDRILHRIEDELAERWLEEWAGDGVRAIEAYLAKHLAFEAFLARHLAFEAFLDNEQPS